MTDNDDKKYAAHRMRVAEPSRSESSKALIVRDKVDASPQRPAADTDRAAAPDARHRAWLRQVVKREK